MIDESTSASLSKNKSKNPVNCLNVDDFEDDISSDQTNIFAHVYDVETKEFTSYTTFHGMIRIFNSTTWTSLIFWCLVVLTCLAFFYFYSFSILQRYTLKPTYQETDYFSFKLNEYVYPELIVCPVDPYSQAAINDYVKYNLNNEKDVLQDLSWRPTQHQYLDDAFNLTKHLSIEEVDQLRRKLTKTCYEMIAKASIDESDVALCDYAVVGADLCLNIDLNRIKQKFSSLKIGFKNTDDGGYKLFMEYPHTHPTTFTNSFHLMPNTRISVYTKFRNNTFLPVEDWGNCISSWDQLTSKTNVKYYILDHVKYSMKTCEHVRAAHFILNKRGCVPYSARKLFQKKVNYCNDTLDMPGFADSAVLDEDIACMPECAKLEYVITQMSNYRISTRHKAKNISKLKLSFNRNIKLQRSQYRLLHLVDVLSKMGGNTSLFCGFSCVTLMETFIFIFKSIIHLVYYGAGGSGNAQQSTAAATSIVSMTAQSTTASGQIKRSTILLDPDCQEQILELIRRCSSHSQSSRGESVSLPSTPLPLPAPHFPRKVSLPTSNDRHLAPRFSIIDTISERDETETASRHPSFDAAKRPSKDVPLVRQAIMKRRQTRTRFRDSINSMSFDTRHRVNEPFVGFQASLERGSFSSPLRPRMSRASIMSSGQTSVVSVSGRRRLSTLPQRGPFIRYNSGIGGF